MLFRRFLYFLALFSVAITAFAKDWDESQTTDLAYPEIEHALKVLRSGPKLPDACDMSKISYECSFASYCKSFPQRDKALYLYENSEGRRIPNTALLSIYSALAKCGKDFDFPTLTEDPFVHPQKFMKEENLKAWSAQKDRLKKIYSDTKARVIGILQDKKNGSNDSEIDNMIARVETVTFEMPDVKFFKDLVGSGCEFPNAFYFPSTHTLTVCPQFGNLPDASVMSVMAHEIGHSFDPCIVAQDLVKIDQNYAVDYAADLGSYIAQPNIPGKIVAASVPLNKNPLSSVINCLQSKDSVGAKIPTLKEIEHKLTEENKSLKDPVVTSLLNRLPQVYPRHGACSEFSKDGKMTESFSDWVSAEVLASKIKSIPEADKARQFAFESQAQFLGIDCPGALEAVQERASELVGFSGDKSCGHAFQNYERLGALSNAYPASPERMTKIIYAHPEIQKALGCRPGKAKVCK